MESQVWSGARIRKEVETAGDAIIQFPWAYNEEHNLMLNQISRQVIVAEDLLKRLEAEEKKP